MVLKFLSILSLFIMIVLTGIYIYILINEDPVAFDESNFIKEPLTNIDYGDIPVFMENLRFKSNKISFFIESSCSNERNNSMKKAFNIYEEKVGVLEFTEKADREESDILIGCSDDYIKVGESLFAAGEGGPSKIINGSKFKIIQQGKISLYHDQECEEPIVEIHEIGHVLGFDHTNNPNSAMYNISKCDQEITQDMIDVLQELYLIKSLPDAVIDDLVAVKRGSRLDFNITITNDGLSKIENISLTISSSDKLIYKIYLGEMDVGYGKDLTATNVKLFSRNLEKIDFIIDLENDVEEINEENNIVQMKISSTNN